MLHAFKYNFKLNYKMFHFFQSYSLCYKIVLAGKKITMFISFELHFKKYSKAGYLPGKGVICAITKIKPRCPDTQLQSQFHQPFFLLQVLVTDGTHISFYPSALLAFQKY